MATLRTLPKNRDRISFLYFEHCRIEQEQQAIIVFKEESKYLIPCAAIGTLLLGPGTSITHAAIKALADNICNIQWVGENLSRFYATGRSGANNTHRLLHQISLWADPIQRLATVRRMYMFRFQQPLSDDLSLQQIRGHEGVRVRTLYQHWSKETGIEWTGRNYKQNDWNAADPINKALSLANTYLYAVCQAAIESVGYAPALGFIHTGKPLSFVYDIADLYKGETTIPAAFEGTAEARPSEFDSVIRRKCRERFTSTRLMPRLVQDIDSVLEFGSSDDSEQPLCLLWDDVLDSVEGGKNWSISEG
ncbi:type I-E CRISPR-associated endonuclease Cas1e [Parathermosynechococcus lividus]|nr:type I-E CRISPR-associated endonuclease Cas1e [Synechococcus sp. PCC 6716]